MFQGSTIHLQNRDVNERVEVLSRTVIPGPESTMTAPFDVVEIRCFASGGADFSKVELFVRNGRGPVLAEALKKAIS
jgi:hypothetical protein